MCVSESPDIVVSVTINMQIEFIQLVVETHGVSDWSDSAFSSSTHKQSKLSPAIRGVRCCCSVLHRDSAEKVEQFLEGQISRGKS